MARGLIAGAAFALAFAAQAVDIAALVKEDLKHEVRPGGVDGSPFWNANARFFMYPPAFDFPSDARAVRYRFDVVDANGRSHSFDARHPTASLAPVWEELPTGWTSVSCRSVDRREARHVLKGCRVFWKQAPFTGNYPPAARGYRECANLAMGWIFNQPSWKKFMSTHDAATCGYWAFRYPSKMVAALVSALCGGAVDDVVDAAAKKTNEEWIAAARVCADWLISISEGPDRPLAYFPPTYHSADPAKATGVVKDYWGQVMLIYPAAFGRALLKLHDATKDEKYFLQAKGIAETYLKLQGEDGTWFLKMDTKTGKEVKPNRLVPIASVIPFFNTLYTMTGDNRYRAAADRAFAYVENGPMKTWNWEGQFEDIGPDGAYRNLTKHDACSTALYICERYPDDKARLAVARDLLRFSEDQFVCWEKPFPDYPFSHDTQTVANWILPAVMEQYYWYVPIDASASKLIRTYLALYRVERNPLDLAKARALGDAMTRMQKSDGDIPTHWYGESGCSWWNCLLSDVDAMNELAAAETDLAADDGRKPETERIQREIDRVSATGGGRVVIGRGVHPCGTLHLKSGVELHLEEGAVLSGGVKSEDYEDAIPAAELYSYAGCHSNVVTRKAFIYAENATNIAITGKGVIDGRGPEFFDRNSVLWERFWAKPNCMRPRMVVFMRCRDVRLADTTFKDSPTWTMWIRHCEDVTVSRIRVEAEQKMINSDGIDFDACRNVRVGDSWFKTGDDCLVLRAIRSVNDGGRAVVCENVVVSNCCLNSACQGVRIGCPSDDEIRHAVFRDIVFEGHNAISAEQPAHYLVEGNRGRLKTSDILFENWKIRCDGYPVDLNIGSGVELADFGYMTFRNLEISAKRPLRVQGNEKSMVKDILFENVRGAVAARRPSEFDLVSGLRTVGFAVTGEGRPLTVEVPLPGAGEDALKTLTAVRDRIRALPAAEKKDGVEVHLAAGVWNLRGTLAFEKADSGTKDAPIVWRGDPKGGTVLRMSDEIPMDELREVTDPQVLERLDRDAAKHVRWTDIARFGYKAPELKKESALCPPLFPEVFFDGNRLPYARWPNSTVADNGRSNAWARVKDILSRGGASATGLPFDADGRTVRKAAPEGGTFRYEGDRPSRWTKAPEVLLQGFWAFDWYESTIPVARIDTVTNAITLKFPHQYGLKKGESCPAPRRWRAIHLLEELDVPGEYCFDFASGRLYLYPPRATGRLSVAGKAVDVIALRGLCDFALKDLAVEEGFLSGIRGSGLARVTIEGVRFRNLFEKAVKFSGAENCIVRRCDVDETGRGGIDISGGDRKTLRRANNLVEDCRIRGYSRHQLCYAGGIAAGGVGPVVRHNEITDAPHNAVGWGANDGLFECNIVSNVVNCSDDAGAFYKGRNPSIRGNVLRHNYWVDIGSPHGHMGPAIYFDDGDGGERVTGNVFVRCGGTAAHAGVVNINGGYANTVENCLFVDSNCGLSAGYWNDKLWIPYVKAPLWQNRLLKEVDITKPPYSNRYPELAGFMDPKPGDKRLNLMARNAIVRGKYIFTGKGATSVDNVMFTSDPGFRDAEHGDYALKPDAEVYRRIPGFRPIPFDKIGLLTPRQ